MSLLPTPEKGWVLSLSYVGDDPAVNRLGDDVYRVDEPRYVSFEIREHGETVFRIAEGKEALLSRDGIRRLDDALRDFSDSVTEYRAVVEWPDGKGHPLGDRIIVPGQPGEGEANLRRRAILRANGRNGIRGYARTGLSSHYEIRVESRRVSPWR